MTTNYATANYQEVIDLHTESNTVSVLGIHTPTTLSPVKMLRGFWDQFRKFKYNGCSISLVPAARLPADPLQVSYAAGEATIDPRDMLNPIMFHGCHGDDLGVILNSMYSSNVDSTDSNWDADVDKTHADSLDLNVVRTSAVGNDYIENLYYRALTDNTWKKAHPQSGFRKNGLRPMVHRIVAGRPISGNYYNTIVPNDQSAYDGASNVADVPASILGEPSRSAEFGTMTDIAFSAQNLYGTGVTGTPETGTGGNPVPWRVPMDLTQNSMFTSRLESLGWLDTRSRHSVSRQTNLNGKPADDQDSIDTLWSNLEVLNRVPKIFMGMILLPPAYKTEQYYRLIINHNFSFKGFRGVSMSNVKEDIDDARTVFNFN
uniref:Capsid protein n=1 Tax=ssDNA virus sp. TaxID=2593122 RepID=A0A894JS21_9VIRU|nr:capsid protein [ssDNA virus sp.]